MEETGNVKCLLCCGLVCHGDKRLSSILALPSNIESRVFVCPDCGFMFLYPYIKDADLQILYQQRYYEDSKMSPYSSELHVKARSEKFVRSLELMFRHINNAKTILDIGASDGLFLSFAEKMGLKVRGVEFSKSMSQKAYETYGFVFDSITLEDLSYSDHFDIVHMNHVLEHFPNPRETAASIYELLNPGGIVYIEVPFQFNMASRIKSYLLPIQSSFGIGSIHHPVFFSPKTLNRLFNENDFVCCHMRIFDPKRKHIGMSLLKSVMWSFLSHFGQGIFIEAIFKKHY